MFSLLILTVLAIVVPSVHGGFCDFVLVKDCTHVTDNTPVCGTNGVSYRNSCTIAKAYCRDNTIHKAHNGDCVGQPTTPAPVHGSEIALDIFCLDLSYIDCPPTGTQVCSSNGKFYPNMCEFDKGKCYHRDMHANGTMCS